MCIIRHEGFLFYCLRKLDKGGDFCLPNKIIQYLEYQFFSSERKAMTRPLKVPMGIMCFQDTNIPWFWCFPAIISHCFWNPPFFGLIFFFRAAVHIEQIAPNTALSLWNVLILIFWCGLHIIILLTLSLFRGFLSI